MPKAGVHPRFKGWPRRKLVNASDRESYPNLWIGGDSQLGGDFLTFQGGRETKAVKGNLCVVCGDKMEGVKVFGRFLTRGRGIERTTDGPAGHPRCIHLAVHTCPHLRRLATMEGRPTVAFLFDGELPYGPVKGVRTGLLENSTGMMDVPEECDALDLGTLKRLAREQPLG